MFLLCYLSSLNKISVLNVKMLHGEECAIYENVYDISVVAVNVRHKPSAFLKLFRSITDNIT